MYRTYKQELICGFPPIPYYPNDEDLSLGTRRRGMDEAPSVVRLADSRMLVLTEMVQALSADGGRSGYEEGRDKSHQRMRAVGLLLMSAGLIIPNSLGLFDVHQGNAMHFLEGLLLGLGITLVVGSLVVRKNKCQPEEG